MDLLQICQDRNLKRNWENKKSTQRFLNMLLVGLKKKPKVCPRPTQKPAPPLKKIHNCKFSVHSFTHSQVSWTLSVLNFSAYIEQMEWKSNPIWPIFSFVLQLIFWLSSVQMNDTTGSENTIMAYRALDRANWFLFLWTKCPKVNNFVVCTFKIVLRALWALPVRAPHGIVASVCASWDFFRRETWACF